VFSDLGWADVLDILIVAWLVYGGILWLRRSQASLIALGIGLLGLVYLTARVLGLELTTLALQSLVAVSVIVVAVIFQEELRQAFEEFAAWVLRRQPATRPRLDTREILAEWLFKLARQRCGALVVLPGRQPLDRHLQGGIKLDGKLSGALLQSLFDPHSDGHDGAVIVANRRVTRFGAHLPLSRNLSPHGNLGTRHAAALGLAERTDALCLVVSEERGTISAARNGRLNPVGNPEQLGLMIDRFYKDRHPLSQHQPFLKRWAAENLPTKGIALATATLLWVLFVPGARSARVTLPLSVEILGLPGRMMLDTIDPPEVRATVRGVRRDFLFLDDSSLRLRVDASLAKLGRRTFELSEQNVSLPGGMVLERLDPAEIHISVRPATHP